MTIPLVIGVNPLQTTLLELGIVSGRVALLLRSAEIQPVFGRFSMNGLSILPPPLCLSSATGGFWGFSHSLSPAYKGTVNKSGGLVLLGGFGFSWGTTPRTPRIVSNESGGL